MLSRYDKQALKNYRSLLQNVVSFVGLSCKSDLYFDFSHTASCAHSVSHTNESCLQIEWHCAWADLFLV